MGDKWIRKCYVLQEFRFRFLEVHYESGKKIVLNHIVRPKKISHGKTQKLQRFPGFFTSNFEVEIKRYPRGIGGI